MIASEAEPFSKSGGLADVASALPRALGRLGHEVTLVTPRYGGVEAGRFTESVSAVVGGYQFDAGLYTEPLGPGASALLVDVPSLYHRAGLYNAHNVDYADNGLRFAFLTIAALEWAAKQPAGPSVVHAHDWQAGLAPAYLKTHFAGHPTLGGVPSVFTIHNLAYQGIFDKDWVPRLGLGWDLFTPDRGFEFWDRLSFLKAGINLADHVTTVSPRYAEEIQTPEFGYGFEGVIHARRAALSGILNGIDTARWDPAADPHLPAPFTADDLSGKAAAKRRLLEVFGLPVDEASLARPVVGIVSRLVDQKGFDLVAALAGELPSLDATFVVLGTGDPRYQDMWAYLAGWRPERFAVHLGFDEARAHLVEGGADLFLMPSRYEPCGLNQMYSQRYGTVPVVRATGGLADTVVPWDPGSRTGTGFVFQEYHPAALLDTLRGALDAFHDREAWRVLQRNGMRQDFSWDRSAREYVTVYKGVLGTPGRRRAS
ncbi:MAG: glycogen synthase GlgA [Vicinamibacterales bacterium]|nr:glycogen synthase GlgA [Vicinamibacterales bacterium]